MKIIFKVLSLLISLSALAQMEIQIQNITSSKAQIQMMSAVRMPPSADLQFQIVELDGSKRSVESRALPLNLWLLFDLSSLCKTMQIDSYSSQIFSQLPQVLDPQSTLTVLGYTQEKEVLLAKNASPQVLNTLKIECQESAHSTSFENSLLQLLKQDKKNNLPTEVWVFSSGNIGLTVTALKRIQEEKLNLLINVYVPMLRSQVIPLLDYQKGNLGDRLSYNFLDTLKNKAVFPELRKNLSFTPSRKTEGKTSTFKLEVLGGKEKTVLGATTFQAFVQPGHLSLWMPYLKIFLWVLLATMVVFIVKAYRGKNCQQCFRQLSFHSAGCTFCQKEKYPSLVIERPGHKPQAVSLNFKDNQITLYQGRYGFEFKGSKTKALLKIEMRGAQDQRGYAVNQMSKTHVIKLNGTALTSSRFLGAGDTLELSQYKIHFLAGEKV